MNVFLSSTETQTACEIQLYINKGQNTSEIN